MGRATKKPRSQASILLILSLTLFCCPGALSASAATGEAALREILTKKGVTADFQVASNRAWALGMGPVRDDTPQGRFLARRAALTDARRNLLRLREELLEAPGVTPAQVSGHLPAQSQRILSEKIEDGIYFLELEMRLDELTGASFEYTFRLRGAELVRPKAGSLAPPSPPWTRY
jgi:hypothetical protein